jgi:hypothetical protein
MHSSLHLLSFSNNTATAITTTAVSSSSCSSTTGVNGDNSASSCVCSDECQPLFSYFISSFLSSWIVLALGYPKGLIPSKLNSDALLVSWLCTFIFTWLGHCSCFS